MTRINEDLVVQYVDGDTPDEDRVVFAHINGSEFVVNFAEVDALRKTLTYFVECHQVAQL